LDERKQAEEALRESEGRFRALIESISDWIWEIDANAVYTYVSPKIKELLGYEPEEIIGKRPFDLMTLEDVKRVAAEFGAIAEAQKLFDGLENESLHKDGQILVIETSGVPIFDANGNFRGYRGIDRDITERKRSETELKEKNTLLVQLGKEPRYEIVGES
jgi:PAS domain S-box-containing protein